MSSFESYLLMFMVEGNSLSCLWVENDTCVQGLAYGCSNPCCVQRHIAHVVTKDINNNNGFLLKHF